MEMKLLPQHQISSFTILLLCSLTFIISYMSTGVNCYSAFSNSNKSDDRLSLIAFMNGITQDPLGILSSWNDKNSSLHFCEWRGVTCSRRHRNRVTGIDLNSQGLVGSISPHIGNLSFLKDLLLYNNSLTGEIPQQIGCLFRLKHMNLSSNSLEGEIPYNISRCSSLTHLFISSNNLVGRIPNELGCLSNLKEMWLNYNNLSGDIPTSLGNLSSLIQLGLGFNNLKGRIPSTLSQLTSLTKLNLNFNKFSGTVPSLLYNISSLESFSLSGNQLHGSIPFDIGLALPNLNFFSISQNNFTGTIPISFSNVSRLEYLQLDTNNLVGPVPSNLGNLKSLEVLILYENNLGNGEANDLNFLNSLVNCTKLRILEASSNNFGGVIPSSIANLTINLWFLDFKNNQIYGTIPPGIQNLIGLTRVYLGDNQFTGSIPPGIGLLQNLGRLDLLNNKLSGSIPSSLGNLTRLIELYLFGNYLTGLIPVSLGNCKSLQRLELYTNRLSGSIPKQIFELPSLSSFLDLSYNSLTGTLPVEVGNLKNLGVLYLDANKLSGEIPSTIGECSSLTELYLGDNLFQGNIPPTITSLKGLEILNLSRNNFSGVFPKGLENLTTLRRLDLSYNNLEGAVPREGVFENASAFLVEGNSKLCGGIPVLKLQDCSVINPNMEQKSRKSKLDRGIIIIIIVFVVLFLTMALLIIIFCWRKKSKTKSHSTDLHIGQRLMSVSYNELLKATNGFDNSTNLLGVGSFGSVYKGILREDESNPVAVKVLHLQQKGATKSFMAECDALRKVRHRNLLKIVTCCSSTDFQGNHFKALVFEFMVNGSLDNWLHPAASGTSNDDHLQEKNLNLERRLSIAVDVASALNYLHHDSQSPIVHCDVKPSNVLLDDDLTARVSDFGLAKFLFNPASNAGELNARDASSIAIKGSIGYVCPEYGMGGEVSMQGDVYSYGILLLEMFTGKRPTDDMFKDGLNIHNLCKMHMSAEHIEEIIDSRLLLDLEAEHSNGIGDARNKIRQIISSIIKIGVQCSSELPSDRNRMNEVIVDVEAVKRRFYGVGM